MSEFLLLIALLVLAALIWKPIREHLLGSLDARAAKIRADLDEAQRLHEEAKTLLAKYQKQLHEGEKLAADIIARAEEEQKRLQQRMEAEFEALVRRRTQQAEDRIAQEEARAVAEVRARAAEIAVAATRRVLEQRIDSKRAQAILAEALDEVTARLH